MFTGITKIPLVLQSEVVNEPNGSAIQHTAKALKLLKIQNDLIRPLLDQLTQI